MQETATLTTGEGDGATFVSAAERELTDQLGFRPYHGTLNLDGSIETDELPNWIFEEIGDSCCRGVEFHACRVGGVRAALLRPLVPDYRTGKVELVAPVRLRSIFNIEDGDPVCVSPPNDVWPSEKMSARWSALDLFDAVVVTLDGAVSETSDNPSGARKATRDALRDHLHDTLSLFDAMSCPVGVYTSGSIADVRAIIQSVDSADTLGAIGGEDTTPEDELRSESVVRWTEELGVNVEDTLLVGDTREDAKTASQTDMSFLSSEQLSFG